MPIDTSTIIGTDAILFVIRISIFVLLFLYIIFSLIIVRQVNLMNKTLMTPVSPIVKALAVFNAGFSIAFFALALGSL